MSVIMAVITDAALVTAVWTPEASRPRSTAERRDSIIFNSADA